MKLLLLFTWILLSGPGDRTAREANRAYEAGDYPRAVRLYREALREEPDAPRLWYNLGNALAQVGNGEEALEAFDQAHQRFETASDRARARYNAGHLMSQLEQYEEAVRLFRDSLMEEPGDPDARHNFELAKRRLEESENEESGSGQSPDSNENEEESENEPQPQPGSPPPQAEDQQRSGQTPPPTKMSPEEAQSLLDALQQQERELIENRNRTEERPESDDANW